MAAIINADDGVISGASGLKLSSDTSGALNIQTNGVTAIAISASQAVSFPATTSLNFASANITNLTSSTATISNTLALSGGTANGMLYLNGSNVVTSGSAVVFNGTNMGIGGTPSSWQSGRTVLQITPSSTQGHLAFGGVISNISTNAFVDSTPAWKYIANGIPALYQQDEGRHFWYTAASGTAGNTISWTQAMTLGGNGNLAIGATNTTVAKLYVVGSGNANSIMTSTAAALTGSANAVWIGDDGTDALIGPGNSGSSLSFLSRAGGVYTKAMTLDASGQLGIGTTSPGALLHVYTSTQESVRFARNSTASSAYITFYANNSSSAQVQYAGILGDVASSTAGSHGGNLLFYTTGSGTSAERARITSNGKFFIGTTTTVASGTEIAGIVGSGRGLSVRSEGGATSFAGSFWNNAASGDNLIIQFYVNAAGDAVGSIDYNRSGGAIRYNTTSDYRAKDVYDHIQNSGETIDALKVYRGKMKGATIERPMMIAHEAQQVVPYAVGGEKDAVNEDGTPKYQTMDHQILVPLLIAEIQSLRQRVAQLEVK